MYESTDPLLWEGIKADINCRGSFTVAVFFHHIPRPVLSSDSIMQVDIVSGSFLSVDEGKHPRF